MQAVIERKREKEIWNLILFFFFFNCAWKKNRLKPWIEKTKWCIINHVANASPDLAYFASSVWDLICVTFLVGVFCTRSSLIESGRSFSLVLDPQRLTDECFCPLYLTCCCEHYNHSGCFLIKPTLPHACSHAYTHTDRSVHTHTHTHFAQL